MISFKLACVIWAYILTTKKDMTDSLHPKNIMSKVWKQCHKNLRFTPNLSPSYIFLLSQNFPTSAQMTMRAKRLKMLSSNMKIGVKCNKIDDKY
jgi:hypothetical protein